MTFKIKTEKNKTIVDYFGIKVYVDEYDTHIATDENGEVHSYNGKPYIDIDTNEWAVETDLFYYIADIDYDGDWKDSLMEITDENTL